MIKNIIKNKLFSFKLTTIIKLSISIILLISFGCAGTYHRTEKEDLKKIAGDKESVEKGHKLFVKFCSECHGLDGRGNDLKFANSEKKPANLVKEGFHISTLGLRSIVDYPHYSREAVILNIMVGNEIMPALKDVLKKEEIDNIADYIIELNIQSNGKKKEIEN